METQVLETQEHPPLMVFHLHQFRRLIRELAELFPGPSAFRATGDTVENEGHSLGAFCNAFKLQLRRYRVHGGSPHRENKREECDPDLESAYGSAAAVDMSESSQMEYRHHQCCSKEPDAENVPTMRVAIGDLGVRNVKPALVIEPRQREKSAKRLDR